MNDQRRKPISQRTRAQVLARDHHKCRMCGRNSQEIPLEVDHIFPYDKGGTDDIDNLASLCRDCNRGKSDLLFRSLLKQKVEAGDFTPIGEVELNVSYGVLTYGNGKQHEYRLLVEIYNNTSKTIVHPQLEVKLPRAAIQTLSSRGEVDKDSKIASILFSQLDVDRIHPQKITKLMETANVGLFYKVNENIHWDKSLMDSQFEVILYGEDTPPVTFKTPFFKMQCF